MSGGVHAVFGVDIVTFINVFGKVLDEGDHVAVVDLIS